MDKYRYWLPHSHLTSSSTVKCRTQVLKNDFDLKKDDAPIPNTPLDIYVSLQVEVSEKTESLMKESESAKRFGLLS